MVLQQVALSSQMSVLLKLLSASLVSPTWVTKINSSVKLKGVRWGVKLRVASSPEGTLRAVLVIMIAALPVFWHCR